MSNSIIYPTIMLIAGIGIPVMAALNSGLGQKLGSAALATTVLFFVGLIISVVYLFTSAYLSQSEALPSNLIGRNIPWYFYLAGTLVAFYILSVTWVSPKYGVGNAVSFVLLGQLIAISIIDHLGLFNAQQSTMDSSRAIGLIMMVIGVFLVIKRV